MKIRQWSKKKSFVAVIIRFFFLFCGLRIFEWNPNCRTFWDFFMRKKNLKKGFWDIAMSVKIGELHRWRKKFENLGMNSTLAKRFIAQTLDGTSVMVGHLNGVQARIKEIPAANVIFLHCYPHSFNLVPSQSEFVAILKYFHLKILLVVLETSLNCSYFLFSILQKYLTFQGVFVKLRTLKNDCYQEQQVWGILFSSPEWCLWVISEESLISKISCFKNFV